MEIIPVVLFFALVIAVCALIDTFCVAILRIRLQGKFKVLIDNPSSFSFRTKLGGFSVDRGKRMLSFVLAGRSGRLPLSDIKGLEYRARVETAVLQEFFLRLNFASLLPSSLDTIEWYSISAVTNAGEQIPIYLGGQYVPRTFLATWYIDLQAAFLERFGLIHDEEVESREVLDIIQRQLGNVRLI